MRALLRFLYGLASALAGLCLVLMLVMIVLNIAGGVFGFFIRGLDAYAGYLMAGGIFLALAHTFKSGEHIRVTLIVERLTGAPHRLLELACLALGVALTGLLAWACVRLAWLSWVFNDVSQSTDRAPLWIPQAFFAFGAVMLFVAFAEDLVDELLGRRVAPKKTDEPAHVE
jgi:TRAP-type C4-dicarboxylate transport system permease small subunit